MPKLSRAGRVLKSQVVTCQTSLTNPLNPCWWTVWHLIIGKRRGEDMGRQFTRAGVSCSICRDLLPLAPRCAAVDRLSLLGRGFYGCILSDGSCLPTG